MKALVLAIVFMVLVGGGVSVAPDAHADTCDRYPRHCR